MVPGAAGIVAAAEPVADQALGGGDEGTALFSSASKTGADRWIEARRRAQFTA